MQNSLAVKVRISLEDALQYLDEFYPPLMLLPPNLGSSNKCVHASAPGQGDERTPVGLSQLKKMRRSPPVETTKYFGLMAELRSQLMIGSRARNLESCESPISGLSQVNLGIKNEVHDLYYLKSADKIP